MAFDGTTLPVIGNATKRSEYVRLRDNDLFLYANHVSSAFQGLHLRTHPDKDVAASKVMLVHADQIILDEGTRLTDWDRLVADIAASGAGGLDTGAEAASKWYQVLAIAKDDGTKNLLLHKSANWASGGSFLPSDDVSRALRLATSTATDRLAQGVQMSATASVDFVDVKIARVGTVAGRIWCSLQADAAGNPSGTPLATSDKLDASIVSTTAQVIRFPFRAPPALTASTQYHLVMEGDYTRSDSNHIVWRGLVAGGYANGVAKEYNGTTWATASGVGDFYFNGWQLVDLAAVTMPTGYTKKAFIGWAYNNSGSNLDFFVTQGRRTHTIQTIALAGSTSAVPTLLDLSSMVPPGVVVRPLVNFNAGSGGDCQGAAGPVPDGYLASASVASVFSAILIDWTNTILGPPTQYQGLYGWRNAGTGAFDLRIVGYEWE